MKTASVYDLKNDLKIMFVKRFKGHGFDLPVIFFTGTIYIRVVFDINIFVAFLVPFRTLPIACASRRYTKVINLIYIFLQMNVARIEDCCSRCSKRYDRRLASTFTRLLMAMTQELKRKVC